jgi:hypothetical protein
MTKNNLPTINLKGKDYVQVKDRVLFFNEEHPNGSIKSEVQFITNSFVNFKAIVTPDIATPDRVFIGRSAGPIDAEKSLEKLETVAVGRALAFMGIGVIESVASADEIQVYESRQVQGSKSTASTRKNNPINLEVGDKLVSGVSKSSGKNWYAIEKPDKSRSWLSVEQYDYLKDMNPTEKAAHQTFTDGVPVPEDLPF